jgi:hypothetical protein
MLRNIGIPPFSFPNVVGWFCSAPIVASLGEKINVECGHLRQRAENSIDGKTTIYCLAMPIVPDFFGDLDFDKHGCFLDELGVVKMT